jgi:heptosyltransferase-3
VGRHKSFWSEAKQARKLLVLDLGFLGDTVHLIPSLWSIRQAWPDAELHVMVAEHVTELLEVTPWVDCVWGYPRFPKGPKPWQDLGRVHKLRTARFDAVINLNGSDRSSILTWLSGAPLRLGRRPQGGGPPHWPLLFTHIAEHPYATMPVYEQRWNCLALAEIPVGATPEFNVSIPSTNRRSAGIAPEEDGSYIHISPFTTQDQKELPEAELVELVNRIQTHSDSTRVVVSCAPNERERLKLARLLERLAQRPWRVFDGSLKMTDLVSVIAGARVHLGGDSGALHLAVMAGVPTVSWFRRYPEMLDWMPSGASHDAILGEAGHEGISGVDSKRIAESMRMVLKK